MERSGVTLDRDEAAFLEVTRLRRREWQDGDRPAAWNTVARRAATKTVVRRRSAAAKTTVGRKAAAKKTAVARRTPAKRMKQTRRPAMRAAARR